MEQINWIVIILVLLAGFIVGRTSGFRSGYKQGEWDAETRMLHRSKRITPFMRP